MLLDVSIRFVNIGLELEDLGKNIDIFGFKIAYYGIIIAIAIMAGMWIAFREAKITGQNVDDYLDFAMIIIPSCIIGARLYYVIFEWDYYSKHLSEIINIRKGGLGIYGAVIVGVVGCYIFTRVKKMSFLKMADTACLGLLLGQLIGRWGNFFNREAFGGYTDNLLAMQIKFDEVGGVISDELLANVKIVDGIQYIQVHPTFLYESLWNLGLLILIMIFRRKKRFDGEVLCWYIGGYAIGRFWIESLRTDQLKVFGIPASMIVAAVSAIIVLIILIYKNVRIYKNSKKMNN
ncbi:MAG: prolipoprotein diacylglyceryl transferase [Lachnospiraceae bacterium]|nr:prolipoprotein diacylglyceryl transferase [Lachnospiraceae bacterium]MBQ4068469.1 prolipoprotein diacylglyceryl transferase [Lachnospiraceae bacterium]